MAKQVKTLASNTVQWSGENISDVKKLLTGANVAKRVGDKLVITSKGFSAVVQKGEYITKEGDKITSTNKKS